MESQRKIEKVVRKLSFAEAEEADDQYWMSMSMEERLHELSSLRNMIFSTLTENNKIRMIEKVILKRNMYEETD